MRTVLVGDSLASSDDSVVTGPCAASQQVLKMKAPWRDGTTYIEVDGMGHDVPRAPRPRRALAIRLG